MSFLRLLVSQQRAAQVRTLSPNPFRRYSILQDFSKKLKGEIDSNPELKKSIKEIQEKAETLKTRTKETAEHLYKHVDAARGEAETRAKQVSSVIKEKISEASEQVKETVGVNLKNSEQGAKEQAHSEPEATKQEPRVEEIPKHEEPAKAGSDARQQQQPGPDANQRTDNKQSEQPSPSGDSFSGKLYKTLRVSRIADVAKEGYNLLVDELTSTRRVKQKRPIIPKSSATEIVPVAKNTTGWRGRLDDLKEKAASHPIFKRLQGVKDHPVVQKSHEIVEEMRERIETSDSPVVHKIQDLNDSIFGETSTAAAKKEIRMRDPSFSLPDFVAEVQESVRPILNAYLKGDLDILRKLCSQQVVERCRAEHRALRSQNMFVDNKILYVSDIEVRESKLVGNEPVIIITFHTQQNYCVRDELGQIKEGSKDDIRTVYYYWAMQYVPEEDMGPDEYAPRWQLREMQQLGVQAII